MLVVFLVVVVGVVSGSQGIDYSESQENIYSDLETQSYQDPNIYNSKFDIQSYQNPTHHITPGLQTYPDLQESTYWTTSNICAERFFATHQIPMSPLAPLFQQANNCTNGVIYALMLDSLDAPDIPKLGILGVTYHEVGVQDEIHLRMARENEFKNNSNPVVVIIKRKYYLNNTLSVQICNEIASYQVHISFVFGASGVFAAPCVPILDKLKVPHGTTRTATVGLVYKYNNKPINVTQAWFIVKSGGSYMYSDKLKPSAKYTFTMLSMEYLQTRVIIDLAVQRGAKTIATLAFNDAYNLATAVGAIEYGRMKGLEVTYMEYDRSASTTDLSFYEKHLPLISADVMILQTRQLCEQMVDLLKKLKVTFNFLYMNQCVDNSTVVSMNAADGGMDGIYGTTMWTANIPGSFFYTDEPGKGFWYNSPKDYLNDYVGMANRIGITSPVMNYLTAAKGAYLYMIKRCIAFGARTSNDFYNCFNSVELSRSVFGPLSFDKDHVNPLPMQIAIQVQRSTVQIVLPGQIASASPILGIPWTDRIQDATLFDRSVERVHIVILSMNILLLISTGLTIYLLRKSYFIFNRGWKIALCVISLMVVESIGLMFWTVENNESTCKVQVILPIVPIIVEISILGSYAWTTWIMVRNLRQVGSLWSKNALIAGGVSAAVSLVVFGSISQYSSIVLIQPDPNRPITFYHDCSQHIAWPIAIICLVILSFSFMGAAIWKIETKIADYAATSIFVATSLRVLILAIYAALHSVKNAIDPNVLIVMRDVVFIFSCVIFLIFYYGNGIRLAINEFISKTPMLRKYQIGVANSSTASAHVYSYKSYDSTNDVKEKSLDPSKIFVFNVERNKNLHIGWIFNGVETIKPWWCSDDVFNATNKMYIDLWNNAMEERHFEDLQCIYDFATADKEINSIERNLYSDLSTLGPYFERDSNKVYQKYIRQLINIQWHLFNKFFRHGSVYDINISGPMRTNIEKALLEVEQFTKLDMVTNLTVAHEKWISAKYVFRTALKELCTQIGFNQLVTLRVKMNKRVGSEHM